MGVKVIYSNHATGEALKELRFSDLEIKAIETDVSDFPEWHANALRHKADVGMTSILVASGQGSRKTSMIDKYRKVSELNIETAKERKIRVEAEINGAV